MNCHTKGFNNCGQRHRDSGHNCGCRESGYGFQRQFISPAEEKEMLEKYKEALEMELAGVEEKLK